MATFLDRGSPHSGLLSLPIAEGMPRAVGSWPTPLPAKPRCRLRDIPTGCVIVPLSPLPTLPAE
jgi:hypothetical protein